MAELTKEDIAYIFEVALLHFEGKDLTSMISSIKTKHIMFGKKFIDKLKEEW